MDDELTKILKSYIKNKRAKQKQREKRKPKSRTYLQKQKRNQKRKNEFVLDTDAKKNYYAKLRLRYRTHNTNKLRAAVGRRFELVQTRTPYEKKFRAMLKLLGIKNEIQKIFFIDSSKYFIVDFYIPEHKCVIEIDGGYHKKQKDEDDARTSMLIKDKDIDRVIRFMNTEVEIDQKCINRIISELNITKDAYS